MKTTAKRSILGFLTLLLLYSFVSSQSQAPGTINGKVADVRGAFIPAANVSMTSSGQISISTRTDREGAFSIVGLPIGQYAITVTADGFAAYRSTEIFVESGKATSLNITLTITVTENVNINGEAPINTSPESNASAIVLNKDDLKALPDNPADLEAALQALAGPSAGPSGGEIFIDGFSGGRMPPKNSIREVRINQNPYSSEYDRPGFGRIEILTKPGTDKWQGEVGGEFEDESVNSRNPFAPNKPPFQIRNINGNIGGPLIKKKTSIFFDGEKEDIDNNALINAQILGPGLVPQAFQRSLVSPQKTYEFSTRVDHQINPNNTLTARVSGSGSKTTNAGLSGFDLASRAYSSKDSDSTLRITETAVVSPSIINESGLQYIRRRASQFSTDNTTTIRVQDAFTGGGANTGNAFNHEDRVEFQNFTTIVHDKHLIKFGARVRRVHILDSSPGNFAGTFTFTSLDQYRNTILHVPGGMPTQFSLAGGDPNAEVRRTDLGMFVQDDWRLRPGLTVSLGLRYEVQTNMSDHADIAPRFSLAYSPGANGKNKPKTVFRAGFGIFYDRFSEGLTLQSIRFDGVKQQQFIVTDPTILGQPVFTSDGKVSNVPTVQTLSAFAQRQTIRRVATGLNAPRTSQIAVSVERQLPLDTTLSVTYVYSHASRMLRSRNVNAPVNGVRPNPALGNIYQYESTGRFNQNQLLFNFRSNLSKRISVFGNYAFGEAHSDSDGAGTFPANQFDLNGEYGNASSDIRHRFVLGGNIKGPFGIALSPFVTYRSGIPFNITAGTDINGDNLFTDRPSFASSPSESGIVITRFGSFDPTPEPGDVIIPRNYGRGPSFFVTNLRIAKEFAFGGVNKKKKSSGVASSGDTNNRAGTNSPLARAPAPAQKDDDDEGRYKLEMSVQIRNLFNQTNGGAPVGNLSSSLFGQPVFLASGSGFGGGRQSGGNRRLRFELYFSF